VVNLTVNKKMRAFFVSSLFDRSKFFRRVKIKRGNGGAYFECNINFGEGVVHVKSAVFRGCLFDKNEISNMTFTDCTFIECRFVAVKMSNLEFHRTKIINCLFMKPVFTNVYLDPRSFSFDFNEWKSGAANINTSLFQRLESNLKSMHQDEFARTAYIQFRRYARWQKVHRLDGLKFREIIKRRTAFLVDCLYDRSMLYGYGIFNVFITTVLAMGAGILVLNCWWSYFSITSNLNGNFPYFKDPDIIQKIYYLVVTVTTVGYGDLSPKHASGMIFVIFVLLFSVVWTATLTAIIVKRIVK